MNGFKLVIFLIFLCFLQQAFSTNSRENKQKYDAQQGCMMCHRNHYIPPKDVSKNNKNPRNLKKVTKLLPKS